MYISNTCYLIDQKLLKEGTGNTLQFNDLLSKMKKLNILAPSEKVKAKNFTEI